MKKRPKEYKWNKQSVRFTYLCVPFGSFGSFSTTPLCSFLPFHQLQWNDERREEMKRELVERRKKQRTWCFPLWVSFFLFVLISMERMKKWKKEAWIECSEGQKKKMKHKTQGTRDCWFSYVFLSLVSLVLFWFLRNRLLRQEETEEWDSALCSLCSFPFSYLQAKQKSALSISLVKRCKSSFFNLKQKEQKEPHHESDRLGWLLLVRNERLGL